LEQIPKSMAEEDLRRYFEPFGPLIEVAIIRDRVTGTHRGCAFVTYESAASGMACIAALHDKVTLEPVWLCLCDLLSICQCYYARGDCCSQMTCAMQVKPADGQSGWAFVHVFLPVHGCGVTWGCGCVWFTEAERRVFVGQLDGRHDRGFLQSLFERFGSIEDIRFLREADGTGHGEHLLGLGCRFGSWRAMMPMFLSVWLVYP
jgi:hypothetical protein